LGATRYTGIMGRSGRRILEVMFLRRTPGADEIQRTGWRP